MVADQLWIAQLVLKSIGIWFSVLLKLVQYRIEECCLIIGVTEAGILDSCEHPSRHIMGEHQLPCPVPAGPWTGWVSSGLIYSQSWKCIRRSASLRSLAILVERSISSVIKVRIVS